jgi:uncharacterized membrane protein
LFGLDFLLVGFAAAMGMGLWRGRSDLAPAGTALLVGLVATQFAPATWVIVASGLSGAIATYSCTDKKMSASPEFLQTLVAMALASFVCRSGGFLLMRFVTVTARLEASLRAIPLAVMIGIGVPAVARGEIPEIIGIVLTLCAMKCLRNDLAAALVGAGVVALTRLAVA